MATALVCDDDAIARRVVEQILTDGGFEVLSSVETAVEAAAVASVARPGLVVIDVAMTGLSGIDIIPELRSYGCEVIVFTAFDTHDQAAREAGAVAAVTKSEIDRLEALVAEVADRLNPQPA